MNASPRQASGHRGRACFVHPGATAYRQAARLVVAAAWLSALLASHGKRAAAREPSAAELVAAGSADDDDAEEANIPEAPPEFEFSLELASAYVFRGYNVFQDRGQREQKMVQRPRLIWTPPRTGFAVGYAAANQLTGDNLADNVAAGLGAEQDLFAVYDFGRRSPLGLATELTLVAYPAAAKAVAGTTFPLFMSAATELRYLRSSFLYVGYLHEVRRGPGSEDYFYVNPRLDKRWELADRLELEVELGAGIKYFPGATLAVRDNMVDVLTSATLYYAINDVLYIGAKVGWAWTNLRPFEDRDTEQRLAPGFGDEYVPFWSLTVGAEVTGRGVAPTSRVPSRHHLHAL